MLVPGQRANNLHFVLHKEQISTLLVADQEHILVIVVRSTLTRVGNYIIRAISPDNVKIL